MGAPGSGHAGPAVLRQQASSRAQVSADGLPAEHEQGEARGKTAQIILILTNPNPLTHAGYADIDLAEA